MIGFMSQPAPRIQGVERRAPPSTAVAIAGGGVIGLSLAYELARRGQEVVVLERHHAGAGAGGVAAGMLAPASEAEHASDALVRLAQDSLRLYPEWVRGVQAASGLDCGLRREGTLLVALGQDDESELARIARFQDRYDVPTVWLTAQQVLDREPQLSPRVTGGLHAPDDWQVDPQSMLRALAQAVVRLGGHVVEGATVDGFHRAGGRLAHVSGTYAAGDAATATSGEPFTLRCQAAVLAAGAWSGLEMHWPAGPLGVRPVKGQLLHLRGPELIAHVVRTPQVYLVPRAGGTLVVGATMEEMGFDGEPTAGATMDLLWSARLALPGVYDLALADVRVGFRPATRDHEPLIGETSVPGLFVATGHFRHGVLLAPATAVLLAEQLTGGSPAPALAPFAPRPALVRT